MPSYSSPDPSSTRSNAKRVSGGFLYDALKAIIDAIGFIIKSMTGK